MYKTFFFLLFFLACSHSNFAPRNLKSEDFCHFLTNVAPHFAAQKIVLIANDYTNSASIEIKFLLKCIIVRYSTVSINQQNLSILRETMNFYSPRSSTLFVMLKTLKIIDNSSQVSDVLNFYVKMWSRMIRPRWLTILSSENSDIKEIIRTSLFDAWKNKFLDFTILELKSFNDTMVHWYNPFKKQYFEQPYIGGMVLFPDKLHDMNQYQLKTAFVHEPPYVYLEQNTSEIVSKNSINYRSLATIAEVLNFDLKIHRTLVNKYVNNMNKILSFPDVRQAVFEGKIDFSGNELYWLGNDKVERGTSTSLRPHVHCALVPIIPQKKVVTPAIFSFLALFTTFYMVNAMLTIKFLNFNKKVWTWPTMVQVILGAPVQRQPRLTRERMFFGCVMLLSQICLSDIYMKVLNYKVTVTDMNFESFEDLDESGLIPLVYLPLFNRTSSAFEESSALQSLKRKVKPWPNPFSCAEQVVKTANTFFCILPESIGMEMVEKYRKSNGQLRLKIAKPFFWITWKGTTYSPGSPYVEKFEFLKYRMFETGLQKKWQMMSRWIQRNDKSENKEKWISSMNFRLLLVIGYLGPVFAFLIEIIVYNLKRINLLRKFSIKLTSSD